MLRYRFVVHAYRVLLIEEKALYFRALDFGASMRKVIGMILIIFQVILLTSVLFGLVRMDVFFMLLFVSFVGTSMIYFVWNKQRSDPESQ